MRVENQAHTYTHARTHVRTHTHARAHTHTHTHTHTQPQKHTHGTNHIQLRYYIVPTEKADYLPSAISVITISTTPTIITYH